MITKKNKKDGDEAMLFFKTKTESKKRSLDSMSFSYSDPSPKRSKYDDGGHDTTSSHDPMGFLLQAVTSEESQIEKETFASEYL